MFAVSGWSLSSTTPRTQLSASQKPLPAEASSKPSTKRKREHQEPTFTADNLESLWRRHIEDATPPSRTDGENPDASSKKTKKKRRRGGKTGEKVDGDVANEGHASTTSESSPKTTPANDREVGNKKKKKAEKKGLSRPQDGQSIADTEQKQENFIQPLQTAPPPRLAPAPEPTANLTPLQSKMREKLLSSRFRQLNETLYSTPSSHCLELFTDSPSFFTEYHEGFRRQVAAWPENPVDGFLRWIIERGSSGGSTKGIGSQKAQFRKHKGKGSQKKPEEPSHPKPEASDIEPLPRNFRSGTCTIADLGCGDAKLAQKLTTSPPSQALTKSLNLKIHSFDLASTSPLITVADIKSLPLPDGSVDIAIFSLALMGTNWIDFVEEAYRILSWKGECWISEVNSRFAGTKSQRVEHSLGNRRKDPKGGKPKAKVETEDFTKVEEVITRPQNVTDVSSFVSVLRRRGFELKGEPDLSNKMFVRMRFLKALTPTKGKCVPSKTSNDREDRRKFIEPTTVDDVTEEEEAKVLKPCLYKTR